LKGINGAAVALASWSTPAFLTRSFCYARHSKHRQQIQRCTGFGCAF
jgi:hypothetical protein